MPRRFLVAALLMASSVLAVVMAWALGGDPPPLDGTVAAAARRSAPALVAAAPPLPVVAPERLAADAGERLPIPADAAWTAVRVLDGASGAPVADAEVVWLFVPGGMLPWEQLRRLPPDDAERLAQDREAATRAFGHAVRSDADGWVRVAVPPDGTRLHARAPGRYGTLLVAPASLPPPGGHRLLLLPDHELVVRVRAADGSPAIGVPLRLVRDDWPEPTSGSPIRYRCVRTTAPDGVARFDHLQDRCTPTAADTTQRWRVRVELPLLTGVSAAFAAAAPPATPLELQLPPTGRVLARTHCVGRRADHVDTILLFPDDPDALRSENRAAWRTSEPDGWVTFRHVPLGQRFVARASFAGWLEQPFAGPVAAGETVRVEFAEPADLRALTGRLVDENGAPLPDVRGHSREEWHNQGIGASGGGELTTDAAGRFRYLARGGEGAAEFTQLDFIVSRPDAAPLHAKLGPRTFGPGTTDLGDVVMTCGPVLVAGRLQAVPGQPRPRRFGLEVRHGIVAPGTDRVAEWRDLPLLDDWQAEDGRFVVLGERPTGPCELIVYEDRTERAVVPFTPGQRDLVVELARDFELWATVQLPRDLPRGVFGTLQPAPAGTWDWRDWRGSAFPEPHDREVAAMRWRHLQPGRYTLTLRLQEVRAPLLTIADIDVPGPAGGDPRLLGIDLRALVQEVTVHVTTTAPFAAVLQRATVALPQSARAPDSRGFPVRDGIARCVLPAGPQDLFVHCDAMQTVALPAVQGEATAVLARWPEVEVTLTDLPPLPAGVVLRATSKKAPGSAAPRELQAFSLCPVVEGRVTLPYGPGPQVLELMVEHNGRTRWFDVPLPLPPGGGPAALVVHVAEPLQAALAKLAADAKR